MTLLCTYREPFGNYVVSVMSVLSEFARTELHWIKQDQFKGLRKRDVPEDREAAHIPWTDDAVAAFRAGATARERLIFELGLGSVQRPADWDRFCWSDYEGGKLRIVQGKTGKALLLPVTPELVQVFADAVPPDGGGDSPILTTREGQRMDYRTMAQVMLLARDLPPRPLRRRSAGRAFDASALRLL